LHDRGGFLHQALGEGDIARQALGIQDGLPLEQRQANVDACQRLGDDVVQLPADSLSFLLLRDEQLTREFPELELELF